MPARGIPGTYAPRGHFVCAREGHSKYAARERPRTYRRPSTTTTHYFGSYCNQLQELGHYFQSLPVATIPPVPSSAEINISHLAKSHAYGEWSVPTSIWRGTREPKYARQLVATFLVVILYTTTASDGGTGQLTSAG